MTQADRNNTLVNPLTCVPPPLPDYLARTYTLKTIVGVPTDEDVKQIHDVIRAVNHLSNVPEMYDPKLLTQLAQFLFSAQMAVYRSEYPLSIFPVDTTYKPPTFPSHIPISLEPVVGAPSHEQIHAVQNAVRTVENLVNTPFIYDPILSTKLSQHLFNIQFARYLQDSIQGQSIQAPVQVKTSSHEVSSHPVPNDPAPETHTNIHQEAPEPVLIESGPPRETPPGPAMPNHAQPEPITTLRSSNHVPEPEVALQGTSYQPSRVEELLMDIRRALVGTHNDLVRHSNSSRYYVMMNEKGEIPWLNNLPYIKPLSSTNLNRDYTDAEIVGYLRCYNLGHDLIYDDGTEKLKQGSESAARKLLAKFLYTGCTA